MEYSNRKIRSELIYTFIQTSKGSVISSVIWASSFHETLMEKVSFSKKKWRMCNLSPFL